ncbi:MAG: hypothetical protein FJW27_02155 [Acidimicrobiia bacterium]|nr:hypothetical protein [Acidimicrobiia bacterium]
MPVHTPSPRTDGIASPQSPQVALARVPGALSIVVLFLVIIVAPGLGLALGLDRATVSESELRELAKWPAWSWRLHDIRAWPAAFQTYFDDHFLFRNRLIDGRASLLWTVLGTSGSDQVIVGKNGWLFYAADGGIDDWIQLEPFTREELDVWRDTLVRRRAFLARRRIPYVLVIAPDKQMIYPEHMPGALRRLRHDYRADQLIAYMRETEPDFRIIDLRVAVLAHKDQELLYHRYDTHWNDRGGLVAYRAIASELTRWFPSLVPLRREDFDDDPAVPSGDRTTMLGLTDPGKASMSGLVRRGGDRHRVVFPDRPDPYGEVGELRTEHADSSLPRLMMFRDSFAGRLIPYLSEHFSHATYFWQNELDFQAIETERPDVVIQEYVGRHLVTYVPYPGIVPH